MKKTIDYYMSLPYKLEIIPDIEEGGYGARYPELPGCITCADTIEDVVLNAQEAKKAWLEAAISDGIIIAEPQTPIDPKDTPSQYKLRLPKSLYLSLKEHAEQEGISMNQYCMYLLTLNDTQHSLSK